MDYYDAEQLQIGKRIVLVAIIFVLLTQFLLLVTQTVSLVIDVGPLVVFVVEVAISIFFYKGYKWARIFMAFLVMYSFLEMTTYIIHLIWNESDLAGWLMLGSALLSALVGSVLFLSDNVSGFLKHQRYSR